MSNQDDSINSSEAVTPKDETANAQPAASAEQLAEKISQLETSLKSAGDRELLARADYENLRRRSEKELEEVRIVVKHVVLTELLPVLDSLKQALENVPNFPPEFTSTIVQKWLDGLTGIDMQLSKSLKTLGIEKIDCVGKTFDPQIHEAVRQMVGETDGMVVEELQAGYTIDGKLLRPSQVVVSQKL